ncbi:hypothetical protein ACFWBX_31930 [Streptomyces sp. NPDC059991]|uniref:hypothetical protein n=1 Tax=Streptomyces sp. NPDC059991 TaxID=3347028 RepID=UPI0036C7BF97
MRHRRAAQYASLIRFGDHYIADAVAGLRRLQRTYVATDLRRSRDRRPHDGHILARWPT